MRPSAGETLSVAVVSPRVCLLFFSPPTLQAWRRREGPHLRHSDRCHNGWERRIPCDHTGASLPHRPNAHPGRALLHGRPEPTSPGEGRLTVRGGNRLATLDFCVPGSVPWSG